LKDEESKYKYEKLRKIDSIVPLNDSEILFVLDLVPKDSSHEVLDNKKKEFITKIKQFLDLKEEKPSFLCRIYLLNVSNVTFDDSLNKENAFYWIKRYDSDTNFKQDKKFFDIEDGEINDTVSIPVKWPVKFISLLKQYFYRIIIFYCMSIKYLNIIGYHVHNYRNPL